MENENAPMTGRDSPVDKQARPGGGTDGLRSRESSGPRATVQAAVKEAVAIAAGKKGMGQSDDDDGGGKSRSNMLCYLYWLLVMLIVGLISFTVWLSVQLARRHSVAMLSQSKCAMLLLLLQYNIQLDIIVPLQIAVIASFQEKLENSAK